MVILAGIILLLLLMMTMMIIIWRLMVIVTLILMMMMMIMMMMAMIQLPVTIAYSYWHGMYVRTNAAITNKTACKILCECIEWLVTARANLPTYFLCNFVPFSVWFPPLMIQWFCNIRCNNSLILLWLFFIIIPFLNKLYSGSCLWTLWKQHDIMKYAHNDPTTYFDILIIPDAVSR